jgi:hypothetical protein
MFPSTHLGEPTLSEDVEYPRSADIRPPLVLGRTGGCGGRDGLSVSFLICTVRDPKESGPTLTLVNPTVPARVHARSRADRRLQSMTLGAAALGIAATGAFGYAAALTYAGTTATANAADQQAGFGDQGQVQPGDGNGSAGQSGTSGGNVVPFSGNQQPVNPPTTTRHRSHTVTGGS